MQLASILFLAIQAAGVLSAPYAGNTGDAPDLSNSSIPPPGTAWARSSVKFVCEIGFPYFALPHPKIPSPPGVASPPLPMDVISAKTGAAAGKSVVMAGSGAGLLPVTDLETGSDAATGDSVT
ncbi:hypothetical protein FQN51_009074 [Onygenales sp. PD_10]|nr:hypothetical protein FQN51_009074 [Onygenales sp. PD_10]